MIKIKQINREKIVIIVLVSWSFISIYNYVVGAGWDRGEEWNFVSPLKNLDYFFSNVFLGYSTGISNKELMIYVVLPWLTFSIYQYFLRKEKEKNDQAPN
jgi:hypothetical protein